MVKELSVFSPIKRHGTEEEGGVDLPEPYIFGLCYPFKGDIKWIIDINRTDMYLVIIEFIHINTFCTINYYTNALSLFHSL